MDNEEEAVKLTGEVKELLYKAGFKLTKFTSNSKNVLMAVPECDRSKTTKNLDLDMDDVGIERALGTYWNIASDTISYSVNNVIKPITKRGILSVLSSVYDPLGLVSPCVVVGKMLFQDATRLKLGWRETIPSDICEKWKKWAQYICYHFQEFSFPRCIKPSTFDDAELELHTFCDASEKAYGCCSYMKCVTFDQKVITTLVMSKGRIWELK